VLDLAVADTSLFVFFDERFESEDLAQSCTDTAGAATLSFSGDTVNTSVLAATTWWWSAETPRPRSRWWSGTSRWVMR
jgi:hypothetical protein